MKNKSISIIWSVEDVLSVRPDLTEEQAWEVLTSIKNHHDATIGVNWDVLNITAALLYGEADGVKLALLFIIEELNNSSEGWHTSIDRADLEDKNISEEDFEKALEILNEKEILAAADEDDEESIYVVIYIDYAYKIQINKIYSVNISNEKVNEEVTVSGK